MTEVRPMPDSDPVVHAEADAEAATTAYPPPLPLPTLPGDTADTTDYQHEEATNIPTMPTTTETDNKRSLSDEPALTTATHSKKRKLHRSYNEPTFPQMPPFNPTNFLEPQIDPTVEDHSNLLHAFQEPLFTKEPSPILSITYSHRDAAVEARKLIRKKKRATLSKLQQLRQEFFVEKQQLLTLNSQLRTSSKTVGAWTKKVFDLELKEPNCAWNDKLFNLQQYVQTHGKIPEHSLKTRGTEEEKFLAAFIAGVRSKVKKGHFSVRKFPHRMEALEKLGVHWASENEARFEIMFAKLLEYKKEHGTFRMPSLDLCKESKDEELILLHNWVFSQVGSFRYQLPSKKVKVVQRFLDVGFSFEKWYGTNGHVFDRTIPPFNAICKRYVENGGVMVEEDVEILKAAAAKSPKKGKTGKRRKKVKVDEKVVEVEGAAVAVPPAVGDGAATTVVGMIDVEVEGTAVATAGENAATTVGEMGGEIVEGELKVNEQEENSTPKITVGQEDNAPALEVNAPALEVNAQEENSTPTNTVGQEENAPAPMEGVETVTVALLNTEKATEATTDGTEEAATTEDGDAPTNTVGQEENAPAPMEGAETATVAMLNAVKATEATTDVAGEAATTEGGAAPTNTVGQEDNAPAPMEGVETVTVVVLNTDEATNATTDGTEEAATTEDGTATAPPATPIDPAPSDAPQDAPPMEVAPEETVATKMEETVATKMEDPAINAAAEAVDTDVVAKEAVVEQEQVKMEMDKDVTLV